MIIQLTDIGKSAVRGCLPDSIDPALLQADAVHAGMAPLRAGNTPLPDIRAVEALAQ
ncbi:MAG: hypothetical protein Q7S58_20265 [Candidatus Binatus sp.]|uniref:hypothetical protein n=1 Tax=Candidatus Binatus sp. TaxID=2811406 RepID=UPI00271ACD9F|nr:hypothetical protein [Candidatus Binatus sp.]MDO8434739.1 hypothetical protein [Candidatus Binatus sp.]